MDYKSIVIAGAGSVGRAFLKMGKDYLRCFDQTLLVEKNISKIDIPEINNMGIELKKGDIEDENFVVSLIKKVKKPAIFLNICSDVDTVRLRESLKDEDIAYIDTAGSRIGDTGEIRFSRMMAYTEKKLNGRQPHILCQGINPGMVEIIARCLMEDFESEGPFNIEIIENDTLSFKGDNNGYYSAGWCVDDLIEEMVLSPTLEIRHGSVFEKDAGISNVEVKSNGEVFKAKVAGHEDVWNLGRLKNVESCRFCYGLSEDVMRCLDEKGKRAKDFLKIPAEGELIEGKDSIIVSAADIKTGERKARQWAVDHGEICKKFGINGVQYQTAKSVLFSMLFLLKGGLETSPGTYNSSTLPINGRNRRLVDDLIDELEINWVKFKSDIEIKDLDYCGNEY